jgi:membrane protease YdiL (CAAX protease family)
VTTIIQHLLFVFLLFIAPAWDYYDTKRVKRNPDSARRIRYYRTVILWLWIAAIVACAVVGPRSIFTIVPASYEAPWLYGHLWVRFVVDVVLALLTAAMVLPYLTVTWMRLSGKPRTYKSADLMPAASYAYLLPVTRRERRWWILVGITAGLCEEIVFRGFLLFYLHTSPWKLDLTLALLLSSAIFGLQHLYQGAQGVAATFVLGALFGLFFLLTGNLVFSILLHAATDLRLLVMLRPATE